MALFSKGANPAADTPTAIYTTPTGKEAVVSTISIAETSNAYSAVVSVKVTNDDGAFYVLPPMILEVGARYGVTEGWTLPAGAVVTVEATSDAIDFVLSGSETGV